MKFCFIILHYKNFEDTIECVESIFEKLKNKEEYRVIIVDNGSNDISTQKLEKYMKENQGRVEIIFSKQNLGFAKGNNLGASYTIEKYEPDFLIVINNDTLMIDENFFLKVEKVFKKKKFDILGPYIEGKDGQPQNPYINVIYGRKQILKNLIKNRIYLLIEYLNLNILRERLRKIKKVKKYNYTSEQENEALMGAALIFSKQYYEKYEHIFYEKTFMYCEEDILYYRIKKDKLISIYAPNIRIFHKEESTTNKIMKTSKKQRIFKLKHQWKSLFILLKLFMEKEGRMKCF
ncbi:glycosyltransferase [Fusobacterium mortiferum]|uniref:glycosyltransferase n=1 Tax=Fusobacterium mortiferum TaxID=850 RepID=UPI0019593467|nr:glycosyltransferase [Fusobacterium mortiferum]